jgi:predicted N-acetyltransferase YhbS
MASGDVPAPRAPESQEFASLRELLDGVFRASGGSMARDYPRLLTEPNRLNLRVIVESGRVVSHAGLVCREAVIEGVRVTAALLGSVATAASHRGRGYGSAVVRSAVERALELGADVMWISGDRPLYRRLGARSVGDDLELDMPTASLARLRVGSAAVPPEAGLRRPEIEVRHLSEEDIPSAAEHYSHEAVRFVRPLEDWRSALRARFAMDGPCSFLGAWESGRLAAYVVARRADSQGVSLVAEYAGARSALLAALPAALEEVGGKTLRLHVPRHDRTLSWRLAEAGFEGSPQPSSGTVLVLRFDSLMTKLRSRFLERAGESAASELSFAEDGPPLGADNLFRIACGPDVIRIRGRGVLAELLFGTPGCALGAPENLARGSSEDDACVVLWGANADFRAVLPVPALWYGLNFI